MYYLWCLAPLIPLQIIGSLQVLCEILKSGPIAQVEVVTAEVASISAVLDSSSFSANTVVRKYKTKFVSRAALRLIPTKAQLQEGADVPESVEVILEQLFEVLQDKVRNPLFRESIPHFV